MPNCGRDDTRLKVREQVLVPISISVDPSHREFVPSIACKCPPAANPGTPPRDSRKRRLACQSDTPTCPDPGFEAGQRP